MMSGYGGYEAFGWLMGGGMTLMMALFWIVPIALVARGVVSLSGGQRPSVHEEMPLEILRRRYASGEIVREEFEETERTFN